MTTIQEQVGTAWQKCLREYTACLAYDRFEKDPSVISRMGHTSRGYLHGVYNVNRENRENRKNKISWYHPPAPPKGHVHRYVVEGYSNPRQMARELSRITGQDISELVYGPFDAPTWRRSKIHKYAHQLFPSSSPVPFPL